MATYWITKHALTDGVVKIDLPVEPNDDGYVSYIQQSPRRHFFYGKKDWHRTADAAAKRADQMRSAKIASLRKQIEKLEALRFTPCP